MPFFDTHAHLDDDQIFSSLENYLEQASQAGVVGITAIGTNVRSSHRCAELAQQFERVYAAVGIHPNECQNATDSDWEEILNLVTQERVVAIGETGLDRHWDFCPFEIQKEWFGRHIELSFHSHLPLVIHMRDCEADILDLLEHYQRDHHINGIMHSFCGRWETAKRCLDWGMYISFAGMVTFKNAQDLREIAAKIPRDRLLAETDAPYLTPHPFRGQRPNHPAMVRHTVQRLAEVKGIAFEEMAELTTQNAENVFGIKSRK